MAHQSSIGWIEPLVAAQALSQQLDSAEPWVFLYSAMQSADSRYSLLAWGCEKQIRAEDFSAFDDALKRDGHWFGYLGYGLKNSLEKLPQDEKGEFHLPALWMLRFRHILRFDHLEKTVTGTAKLPESKASFNVAIPLVSELSSNMTKQQYMQSVERTVAQIEGGQFYQANITRKFQGTFAAAPHSFALFSALCRASPAPYSAFLQLGEVTVISSSPECFLKVDEAGNVITRPIKGSAPRAATAAEDEKLRQELLESGKDKAENLMIVDLMRNDLSHHCIPGSVQADHLFEVITYATVHHMVSTVRGKKLPHTSTLDVVKSCFPPGSMTGAPKIEAMKWCSAIETLERGVYSGALGWFSSDGACDLSVVIRTLLVKGDRFEFQVGGGIVADSEPEAEWRETLTKARGIAAALGIDMKELENI